MTRRLQSITHLLLVALVAGLICTASQASAQSAVRVHIPFAFTANQQQLPAGYYRVQLLSENLLSFAEANTGKVHAYILVHSTYPDVRMNHSSLVFNVNEGRYTLTDLRIAEIGRDSQLAFQPKHEKMLTKNARPAESTVELALK